MLRKKLLSPSAQLQYYLFKYPRINKVYILHIFQHSFINPTAKIMEWKKRKNRGLKNKTKRENKGIRLLKNKKRKYTRE